MSFLEESWTEREEVAYPNIFGGGGIGIYPLSQEIFDRMGNYQVDPRWLTYGVYKFQPTQTRKTWAYVTSGMSNPWEVEEPEAYSGLGTEFILETGTEENWAIEILLTLTAYNLLLASGQMGEHSTLNYGHRVPLALSASIKTIMFVHPVNFPVTFTIKSGSVDLLQIIGITSTELDFAKQESSDKLKELIIAVTGGLVTKLERASVV